MRKYNRIPFWVNLYRWRRLNNFISLTNKYVSNSHYDWQVEGRIEEQRAKEVREPINLMIPEINNIVKSTDNSSVIVSYPAPAVGGYVKNINIFDNFFNLHSYQIPYDDILNQLNRSKGVLKTDFIYSIIRTLNPFYWIGMILGLIVNIPFQLIGKVGFDNTKFENSIIGKLIKILLYIVTVVAAIITILQAFKFWDKILEY